MASEKDIEQLLKNIQEGLKKYTVKELNDAIISILNKKDDKTEEIGYVFELICQEFDTSVWVLKQNNVRGVLHDAKQICYCILHFNLGLSTRYIADRVFSNWHTAVHKGIQRLKNADVKIKPDKDFVDKYESVRDKFIEKFTQKELVYEH